MRLIDADALLERMEERLNDLTKEYGNRYAYTDGYEEGYIAVEEAPTVEEQGLLLRLPCKVEDTLYIIEPSFYNYEKHEGVQKGICKGYELNDRYGRFVKVKLEYGEKHSLYFYNFSKFGETVFLTREAAEAKLKEMEG